MFLRECFLYCNIYNYLGNNMLYDRLHYTHVRCVHIIIYHYTYVAFSITILTISFGFFHFYLYIFSALRIVVCSFRCGKIIWTGELTCDHPVPFPCHNVTLPNYIGDSEITVTSSVRGHIIVINNIYILPSGRRRVGQ